MENKPNINIIHNITKHGLIKIYDLIILTIKHYLIPVFLIVF